MWGYIHKFTIPVEKRLQSENVIFKVNEDQLGIRFFLASLKKKIVISI